MTTTTSKPTRTVITYTNRDGEEVRGMLITSASSDGSFRHYWEDAAGVSRTW